ncbi:hypothetical protein K439DRAFT_1342266 [Ramaria rubella]|nr:hypothetical protein K439DRAFT_1342266 [Ramaria rubella]
MSIHCRQLAITPGYAFTDYKVQGQTIPYLIVDIGAVPNGKLMQFNAYVSMSHGPQSITVLCIT